jgi:hypothetical protein
MSGLSFYCKLNDFEDNTNIFIVRKFTDGVKHSRSPQIDSLQISTLCTTTVWFETVNSLILNSPCYANEKAALNNADS